MDVGAQALSEYIFASKYAHVVDGRRETYDEAVARVMQMHRTKYAKELAQNENLAFLVDEAERAFREQRILGSQRNLQFGGPAVLRKNVRAYNCCASYCDRPRFFQEALYNLLCGAGVGFSVQKHHVAKLPAVAGPKGAEIFYIEDSIEGWCDALGALINAYLYALPVPDFRYHYIRPKGAAISSTSGKAPGPEPLRVALEAVRRVLDKAIGRKLKPIECYDITMHVSCAVLSGGVRRSATIAIFSPDDEEMLCAKTGNWMQENPQRARSNNSALLLRGQIDFENFKRFVDISRQWGEPGFFWADSTEIVPNPCVEVGFYPVWIDGRTGWQFCNLCTINGRLIDGPIALYEAARMAAVLGTLQAGYTDFWYLGEVSELITRREALLGISITGVQDSPSWCLSPYTLKRAMYFAKCTNATVAKWININAAARLGAEKPEGSSSCLVKCASGMGPYPAKRFIRRVQCNDTETVAAAFAAANPLHVEKSVWREGDFVLKFPIEAPEGAVTKHGRTAIDQLRDVLTLKENWIDAGRVAERCAHPAVSNNVSNTISVREDEWDQVAEFIYAHQDAFAGVSLLAATGDLDYPQAPFVSVDEPDREALRDEWELLRETLKPVDYSKIGGEVSFAELSACAGGKCDL
jgi:ribonucleoside-triphosphate reductase (thioredoxin)